ncbi:Type II secretory pathway competence component [Levilactobacillus paucivorans]|uniref:Type II secretory pathway competence component n=1 Tax=Levilactobacillus paucivorans TaxID=616990 RepID=A0A0R2LWM8_9LACO|nr:type II secretion system F family protein [Levilactobacillus paucivorans]KRO04251.1 Type II secretory pathway competence component [Levilactobacillus paucivorans]
MLADQLASGFSLKQAVAFIRLVDPTLPATIGKIERQLASGQPFVHLLEPYLQPNVYFQLWTMTTYGELGVGLQHAAEMLRLMATQRKRLHQLLVYPAGLLVSMLGLFLALQIGVLPQLQAGMGATETVGFPWTKYLTLGCGLAVLGGGVIGYSWWRQKTSLQRATSYLHWPVLGRLFRAYYAYYLAATLGQLVQSGLSVQQMLTVLQRLPEESLLAQLATALDHQLTRGQVPTIWLRQQAYIAPQLVILLQKGSTTAQLARELQAFGVMQYRELTRRWESALAIVQPLLLGVVALMIVGAYLSLLLPMYANLQGVTHG